MPNPLSIVKRRQSTFSSYESKKDQEVIELIDRCIAESSVWCEPEHKRCEENERYAIGMQWSEGDAARQAERERPALPINKIRKALDAVANREIMDRFVPKVYARDPQDAGVAEVQDELNRWQRDISETDHEESAAFRKNCMSGLGVMHKWWNEAAFDGLGMVQDENVPVWQMLWDPRARKSNMVDRTYHISGKYVAVKELHDSYGHMKRIKRKLDSFRLGGRATDSSAVSATGTRWGWRDIVSGDRWYLRAQEEAFVVEFEWLEKVSVWKVAVPDRMDEWREFLSNMDGQIAYSVDENGEPLFVSKAEYNTLMPEEQQAIAQEVLYLTTLTVIEDKEEFSSINSEYEAATGVSITFRKKPKDVIRYAIRTRDIILEEGVRPFGYTYEWLTGVPFEQREGMRWRGMVDFAKGPQDMLNVFMSNMLTMYMTSGKGNLLMEEGLVADSSTLVNDYAKLSGITLVPDGVVQQWDTRVKTVDSVGFPPMLKEQVMLMNEAVEEMFGLSSLEMGAQGDLRRVSGTVAGQARQASNTMLAIWFDSLRRYRKRFGMLNIKMLQAAYTTKEMARIVGGEVAAGLDGMAEWPDINRYDVKIDEAPTSVTEQIEMSNLLLSSGTLEKYVNNGHMLPEDSIDMMYAFPKSQREKIKANMQTMKKIQGQMEEYQKMAEDEKRKNELLMDFLLQIDRGGQIKQSFDVSYGMAQLMAEKMMEQQQQGEQPPADQAQGMG